MAVNDGSGTSTMRRRRGERSGDRARPKVVHMTSVHSPLDPRIFMKECAALAAAGYEVVLIAPGDRDMVRDGIGIRAVKTAAGRMKRMLSTTLAVFRIARAESADVYHFHDPELIPWGLVLRLLGHPVIYDVHEDYVSAINQRSYLAGWLRPVVATAARVIESLCARVFYIVIAERYYLRRFPDATMVLNYPTASPEPGPRAFAPRSRRLLYTGNVTADRGALIHAGVLRHPTAEVHVIGRCSGAVAAEMRAAAGSGADRLFIEGVDTYVPFSRIQMAYDAGNWLCGLAIFPATPHYTEKELTKFFEYMQAGLPIVCSDFPVWRALVEEHGVGLCVPPDQPDAVIAAIDWLIQHPAEAEAMGQRGRQLVAEQFNWPSEAKRLTSLYARILGNSADGPPSPAFSSSVECVTAKKKPRSAPRPPRRRGSASKKRAL
jgi:glycosyltransferase involved in cell wall biosynthesis